MQIPCWCLFPPCPRPINPFSSSLALGKEKVRHFMRIIYMEAEYTALQARAERWRMWLSLRFH